MDNDVHECQCDGAGYCPVYKTHMSKRKYHKCKNDEARATDRETAQETLESDTATDEDKHQAKEEIKRIDAEQQTADTERATAETERQAETQVGDMTLCCSDITVRLDTIIGLLGGASTVQQRSPAASSPVSQGTPQLEREPSMVRGMANDIASGGLRGMIEQRVRGLFTNVMGSIFPDLKADAVPSSNEEQFKKTTQALETGNTSRGRFVQKAAGASGQSTGGQCCSDILGKLNDIIGLLGTGGPTIAVEAAATKEEKTKGGTGAIAKIFAKLSESLGLPSLATLVKDFLGDMAGTDMAKILEEELGKLMGGDISAADFNKQLAKMGMDLDNAAATIMLGPGAAGGAVGKPSTRKTADDRAKQVEASRIAGLKSLEGKDPLQKSREKGKEADKEISIGSSAGRRPGDWEGKLADWRQAAAAAPAGGRVGGGRRRRGGAARANMANRRKAKIDKREGRIKSRAEKDADPGASYQRLGAHDVMFEAMEKKTEKIDVMKGVLGEGGVSKERKAKIEANIKRMEDERAKIQGRMPEHEQEALAQKYGALPSQEAQRKKAEETVAQETIEQQQRQQQSTAVTTGAATATATGAAATPDQKPGPAAGGKLEELLKGTAFAAALGPAFTAGGLDVAGQIKDAFKHVIPPKIEMTGELGVIKVHLTGGDILQKFNGGILEKMKAEITTTIHDLVKGDALKPITGPGAGVDGS